MDAFCSFAQNQLHDNFGLISNAGINCCFWHVK